MVRLHAVERTECSAPLGDDSRVIAKADKTWCNLCSRSARTKTLPAKVLVPRFNGFQTAKPDYVFA